MWEKAYRAGLRYGGLADIGWLLECLKPEMQALEIGCGNGKTYLALRKNGVSVVGIDLSFEALEILVKDALNLGIDAIVEQGDARKLRWEKETFDVVIGIHLLDALETDADRVSVVSEAYRVLRPRGLFLCEVFCVEDFRNGKGRKVSENTYERGSVLTTYFEESKLKELLSNKFDVEIWHHKVQRSYGTRCSLRAKCLKRG